MKLFLNILIIISPLLTNVSTDSQPERFDVFSPIGKYIIKGDTESLAAWFDDNLELTISDQGRSASKNQAKQILKAFFDSYSPRGFDITHTAGRSNMKYAIGRLSAGGESFEVTIFVTFKQDTYKIQQLKIMREK